MKTAALNEVKDEFSKYLRLAAKEDVIITRHGKPAGIFSRTGPGSFRRLLDDLT